ncbi:MAG: hypothetical protein JEZ03_01970 [Bacteroidales bacterium]|nr:hypothetical protein [Bacteroidales bacterium]
MEVGVNSEMVLDLTNLSVAQVKMMSSISNEIGFDFNALSEDILHHTNKEPVDMFCNVVSRNPFQSKLFELCVVVEFVRQNLLIDKSISCVKTNDPDVYNTLRDSGIGVEVELVRDNLFLYKIKYVLNPFKDILNILVLVLRYFRSKNSARCEKISSAESVVLIDTFMMQNSINAKKYIDRYYTGILDFIDPKLESKLFFVPHITCNFTNQNLQKIYNNSKENMIFKSDFLNLTDYFTCLKLLFFNRLYKKSKFQFRGLNLTKVIHNYTYKERFNEISFLALLNFMFIKRLRIENVNVELFIDWNENQAIDKGIVKGVHDFFSGVLVKGYRGFVDNENIFNFHMSPAQYEVNLGLVPDQIIVIGDALKDSVKLYCHDIPVVTGPAFRYMNMYDTIVPKQNDKKSIVVALPIMLHDGLEILKMLASLHQEIDFSRFNVLVKPHPAVCFNEVLLEEFMRKSKKYWSDNYILDMGDFKECMMLSSVLISHGSSVLIEAIAYGVPVIVLCLNSSITQNPIPKSIDSKIWKLVYNNEELKAAFIQYTNLNEEQRNDIDGIGKEVRLGCFKQVTKSAVQEFLI